MGTEVSGRAPCTAVPPPPPFSTDDYATVVSTSCAGAYIGFGYSLCCVCAGGLSKDLRTQQPGLFSFLFGALLAANAGSLLWRHTLSAGHAGQFPLHFAVT